MASVFRKLTTLGVSEFILIFILTLSVAGVIAVSSSSVNFQQVIMPPPPPTITTILGDRELQAVLVVGTATPQATIRVYAFSDPIFVETQADGSGAFFAAFTKEVLPPGIHEFSALTVLRSQQTTDPSPKVAVSVRSDYTIEAGPGGQAVTVKIGNADAVTSNLLRTIIRNQAAVTSVPDDQAPVPNRQLYQSRLILIGLLLIVLIESAYLLWLRAKRKQAAGLGFFHLGRGLYRLPANTAHRPGQ